MYIKCIYVSFFLELQCVYAYTNLVYKFGCVHLVYKFGCVHKLCHQKLNYSANVYCGVPLCKECVHQLWNRLRSQLLGQSETIVFNHYIKVNNCVCYTT